MSVKQLHNFALWQLIAAEVLIGSVGVFVHQGGQDPVTTVFYRCLFGALFLGVWAGLKGQINTVWHSRSFLLSAIASGVLLVLSWVTLFAGMERSSIGVATMLFHCYPFVMLIFSAGVLGERTSMADWTWTLIAFIGLIGSADPLRLTNGLDGNYMRGIELALLAGLLCAASLLISRKISRQRAVPVVFIQCCTGAVMLAPFSDAAALHPGTHWIWLIGLGLIHSGLSYVLLYSSYRHLTVATIAVVSFVYPLVALLFDYFVFLQSLNMLQLCGLGLIILGNLGVTLKWKMPDKLPRTANKNEVMESGSPLQ